MGRTKALLEFGGKTSLERALEAVGDLGPPVVVLGPNRLEVESRVPLGGVRIAVNPRVESGQTASLKAGLSLLRPDAEAFLVYPVDVPLLRRADIAWLVDAFRREGSGGKAIFVPSFQMKRGHPLLCRREVAGEFRSLPETGTAREVLNRDPGRIAYVPFDRAYILMDMDTPEDYERCLSEFQKRSDEEP
jgi:molybdenum cofactor cytidylyltransferase